MNAGFFGLMAYLIEHKRSKGNSMSTTYAAAPQYYGASSSGTTLDQTKCALQRRLAEILPSSGNPDDLLTEAMQYAVLGDGKRLSAACP